MPGSPLSLSDDCKLNLETSEPLSVAGNNVHSGEQMSGPAAADAAAHTTAVAVCFAVRREFCSSG